MGYLFTDDITYCSNKFCANVDCMRHHSKTSHLPEGTLISITNFDRENCSQYIPKEN